MSKRLAFYPRACIQDVFHPEIVLFRVWVWGWFGILWSLGDLVMWRGACGWFSSTDWMFWPLYRMVYALLLANHNSGWSACSLTKGLTAKCVGVFCLGNRHEKGEVFRKVRNAE